MDAGASTILSICFLSLPDRPACFPPQVLDFQASPSVNPLNITHQFSLGTRLDGYRASLSTLTRKVTREGKASKTKGDDGNDGWDANRQRGRDSPPETKVKNAQEEGG